MAGLKSNIRWFLYIAFASILVSAGALGQSKGTARKSAAAQSAAQFEELSKRADQAREAGQLDEAISLYYKGVQMRPKWSEGWWYLGALLYEKDDYADARDAFKILLTLKPKDGSTNGMLGLCEFQTKEYERALEHLQNARVFGLGTNEEITYVVRYHTGILLTRFERFESALEALAPLARQNESPSLIEAYGLNALRM